jgi:hypothetical protein
MEVSIFQSIKNVKEPKSHSVISVLESFKKDSRNIESIRQSENFNEAKRALPLATFGGVFSYRSNNGLIESSGLMTIDIDKVDTEATKHKFINEPWLFSMFTSPSGKGVKLLVRIPQVKNDKEYKEYYSAFEAKYNEVDSSGKDISRACFFSYDPEIYINKDAKEWTIKKTPEVTFSKLTREVQNDYGVANRVLNIIRYAIAGEKHNKVLNASILMGGYVEAGKISYEEAIRLLEQEAHAIAPEYFHVNKKAIVSGLENGMGRPLKDLKEFTNELNKELEAEELEYKHGKIYYTLSDKQEEIDDLYENGVVRGYELSFETAKDLFSIKLGCTTYIYAAPYAGKSQIWFEFLVDLSVNYGLRHAVFSPETGKARDIFIELMTIYVRKDFYKDYNNQMTKAEKEKAEKFIDSHFIVIDPDDSVFTIEEFYDYVDIVERVYNCKIHTTVADPFNEFSHDFSKDNGRQDMYIERILGYIRRNARTNDRHNCLITHVSDQKVRIDEDTKIPYYPPATYREIAGGQAWSRKGEQMICIWRPPMGMKDEHGIPFEENQTEVRIQKSKPKGVGKLGKFNLFYDVKGHSFYEVTSHGEVRYSNRLKESIAPEKKFEEIEINENQYPSLWD